MFTEICQLIRAVQNDDKVKALAYADLLAENLVKDGKPKEAARIRRAITGEHGPMACLDSASTSTPECMGPLCK